ncbi:MAG: hypothetical protein AAGF06_08045, partial [Pseudomonadota bacterium]
MKHLPKLLSFACITYTAVIASAHATHLSHERNAISNLPSSTIQAPVIQTPVIQTPIVKAPAIQAPVVKAPATKTPVIQTPVVKTPVIQAPAVKASPLTITVPTIKGAVVSAPAIQTPAMSVDTRNIDLANQDAVVIEDTLSSEKPTLATAITSTTIFDEPLSPAPTTVATTRIAPQPPTVLNTDTPTLPIRVAMATPKTPTYSMSKQPVQRANTNKGLTKNTASALTPYAGLQYSLNEL